MITAGEIAESFRHATYALDFYNEIMERFYDLKISVPVEHIAGSTLPMMLWVLDRYSAMESIIRDNAIDFHGCSDEEVKIINEIQNGLIPGETE